MVIVPFWVKSFDCQLCLVNQLPTFAIDLTCDAVTCDMKFGFHSDRVRRSKRTEMLIEGVGGTLRSFPSYDDKPRIALYARDFEAFGKTAN
jgi:hypothetical protein